MMSTTMKRRSISWKKAAIGACLLLLCALPAQAITLNDASLEQIAWNGTLSEYGQVDIDVSLDLFDASPFFLNVVADLNNSNTIEEYATFNGIR